MNNELKKDLCDLTRMVYNVSKKHGDAYITAYIVAGGSHSSVTIELEGKLEDVEFWGHRYTKDMLEDIDYERLVQK